MNFSEEEYGQISFIKAIKKAFITWRNGIILKYCMYSVLLGNINYRYLRPRLWRFMGCKISKDVYIGYNVWLDIGNAKLIEIEDRVHIANNCILLCHQRDLSDYYIGSDYSKLRYRRDSIVLKRGCLVSMGCIIMPGVKIGEGAIVGTGSIVIKDIPDWTIAAGNPAKVIKKIPKKDEYTHI